MKSWKFVFFIPLILIYSCKKKDKDSPVISISEPSRNSTCDAGSFIRVKAKVTDDRKLATVTMKVQSLSGNLQIADPINFSISSAELIIDQSIRIGDIHTSSGVYQIVIEASDGTNSNKEFLEINVNEIPRQFRKIIAIQKVGGGFAIDSINGSSPVVFRTISGDFSGAAINNYDQLIYYTGRTVGTVEAYQINVHSPLWTIPADLGVTGEPLFYFNEFDNSNLTFWQSFAGTSNGRLKSIGKNGGIQKNIPMQSNHFASCLTFAHNSYVVCESPMISGGTSYLSYYYTSGFGLASSTPLAFTGKKVFELNTIELVVVGNNGSQGELRIYNKNTNGFWEQVNIGSGRIYDAVKIDNDSFIIAHESGLLRFIPSSSTLYNLTSGNKVQRLCYDEYSGILYACEGSQVKQYNPITGGVGAVYSFSDSVYCVLPHYNK